jgi:transposase-like protein
MTVVLGGQHQMFEDIIKKVEKFFKKDVDEVCPNCSSADVNTINGVFIRGGLYTQTIVCSTCKTEWSVTYGSDLNIIKIVIRR